MFTFNGQSSIMVWLVWIGVFFMLILLNEIARRWKWAGFAMFVVLPVALSILWFTVLKEETLTDWFHLAKVYSSTAGCIIFWCFRYLKGKKKTARHGNLSIIKYSCLLFQQYLQ